jgi:hypothetical protein
MKNEITHKIATDLYSKYVTLVDILEVPEEERWALCDIEVQLDEFMMKFRDVYESIFKMGLEWYPYDFNICLHEYNEGAHFIDIGVMVSDIEFDDEGHCSMGIVDFSLVYNDESLPDIEDTIEETEEERINRLINGDNEDEDEDDKPWLRGGSNDLW